MPCFDNYDNNDDIKSRLDSATRAACELGKLVQKQNVSPETLEWLEEHKKQDEKILQRDALKLLRYGIHKFESGLSIEIHKDEMNIFKWILERVK